MAHENIHSLLDSIRYLDTFGHAGVITCIRTRLIKVCVCQIPNLPTTVVFLMIHDKLLIAFGHKSFKFLVYRLAMAVTGNRELGFDSGEGARDTNNTSKEGRRRANCPILTQGGCDKKWRYNASMSCNWNE